jgi:hypothetical protein
MDCTRSVTPADAPNLQAILQELPAGAVLCLAEGVYDRVHLVIEQSLTLRGVGNVVLDARHAAPTLFVIRKDIEVRVENLTLKRGGGSATGEGGNLSVSKRATVVLRDVVLDHGESSYNGGGGVQARDGQILLERCRVIGSRGTKAQAIQVEGQTVLTLRDSTVAGGQRVAPPLPPQVRGETPSPVPGEGAARATPAVFVDGGARVIVEHSVVGGNGGPAFRVRNGATDGRIALDVQDSIVDEVVVDKGKVRVAGSALPKLPVTAEDAGGNLLQPFSIDAEGKVTPSLAGRGPRLP